MVDSEWEYGIREGYRTKTIRIGNAIVTIHKPLLTKEEQKRREEQVKIGLLNLMAEENNNEEEKVS